MRFSERLQNLMKEKGVKWKAVSEELKIGINQKRYWETHDNIPDGETLKKLADYFDVGIQYLMGETDDRGQKNSPAQMDGAGVDDELRRIWDDSTEAERKAIVSFYETIRGLRGKTE